MKKVVFLLGICSLCFVKLSSQVFDFQLLQKKNSDTLGRWINEHRITLPNNWKLSPFGKLTTLGDLPLQLIPHPTDKWMIAINAGQSDHSIMCLDSKTGKVTDSLPVEKTFYGAVFHPKGDLLFVSGGNNNRIEIISFFEGKLKKKDSIVLDLPWPKRISPTGMALGGDLLYVGSKEDSTLYMVDITTKQVKRKLKMLSAIYDVKIINKGNEIWVSEWGNASIAVINVSDFQIKKRIQVGSNPTEMAIDPRSNRIFVCNANDNTVAVINTYSYRVEETLRTGFQFQHLTGSTPNALTIYQDKLLVANADNNNLVVFDISQRFHSQRIGYIPTGWYPTQVKVINNLVWVSNGKGLRSMANPNGPNPTARKNQVEYQGGIRNLPVQYIGSLFRGEMQFFPVSVLNNEPIMQQLNTACIENFPVKNQWTNDSFHLYKSKKHESPIKHVFYIIKENRTYDQVLSDVKGGDGDTSLLLFGADITPNQHKLVNDFVLLDHFYVDAEVSADGHNWSTAAIANDFTEKTWPTSYGGRGGDYVYEGQWKVAHPYQGFIWDHAKRQGISYRSYGEFVDDYKPNIQALDGHFCPYYTSWDENVRDTTRFSQWRRDFDSLLRINQVPQLNTLRFINDHTEGVRKNRPTPFAHVADNDLAVGMFIDYLSHSKIWESSVVFILEDDAQNGADHIDAHRSTAYVAGGFVKRGFVDHTHYSTSSMLRTIELILGMNHMSQYDALAMDMRNCFLEKADTTPFNHVQSNVDLNEKNAENNSRSTANLIKLSDKLNLTKEDEADEYLMNLLLWKYVKGEKSEFPIVY